MNIQDLEFDTQWDPDSELQVCLWNTDGQWGCATMYLSRSEVTQLRDHLTAMLEEQPDG